MIIGKEWNLTLIAGGLKKHCDDYNIDFISTPSCLKAVDLLEGRCQTYKIGSGDYDNFLLLENIINIKTNNLKYRS